VLHLDGDYLDTTHAHPVPELRLVAAIVLQAIADATSATLTALLRDDAKRWLCSSPDFDTCAEYLGLAPGFLRRACLAKAGLSAAPSRVRARPDTTPTTPVPPPVPRLSRRSTAARVAPEAQRLRAQGMSIRALSVVFGVSRPTVRHALQMVDCKAPL